MWQPAVLREHGPSRRPLVRLGAARLQRVLRESLRGLRPRRELEDRKPIGTYAPFPRWAEHLGPGEGDITDECHACWTRSDHAVPGGVPQTGELPLEDWFLLTCPACRVEWVVTDIEDWRVTGKFMARDAYEYWRRAGVRLGAAAPAATTTA